MTLKEFYERIGGSYETAMNRIQNEERVLKYVKMFALDDSFSVLQNGINSKDFQTAFRGVHTLKGVTANLAFDSLYKASCALTEILRNYSGEAYQDELEEVEKLYKQTIELISYL